MKLSSIFFFVVAIIASNSSFALEFKKLKIQSGGVGNWWFSSSNADFSVMPMTEQVADMLASFEASKNYFCEVKSVTSNSPISSGGINMGVLQVFDIRNCSLTH